MSTEDMRHRNENASGPTAGDEARVLRLAVGVAGSFVIAEIFGWKVTFLAPIIAMQFLARPGPPPSLLQALVILATVVAATGVMEAVSNVLLGHFVVLALMLWLILFLSFFAHFRGAPGILTLLVQISAICIPVISVTSREAAVDFRAAFIAAVVIAFLVTWVAHAMFPAHEGSPKAEETPRLEPDAAIRQAHVATLILMPMLVWYLLDASQIAIVLLAALLIVVRLHDPAKGRRAALGLVIGNFVGGIAAVTVYHLIVIGQSTPLFMLLVLLACLLFARRIVTANQTAPIFAIAFSTFIIVLGLGLTPISGGSDETFAARLFNILVGTAYAVGALSLVRHDRAGSDARQTGNGLRHQTIAALSRARNALRTWIGKRPRSAVTSMTRTVAAGDEDDRKVP